MISALAGASRKELQTAIEQLLGVDWPDYVELNQSRLSYRVVSCHGAVVEAGHAQRVLTGGPWQSVKQLTGRSNQGVKAQLAYLTGKEQSK